MSPPCSASGAAALAPTMQLGRLHGCPTALRRPKRSYESARDGVADVDAANGDTSGGMWLSPGKPTILRHRWTAFAAEVASTGIVGHHDGKRGARGDPEAVIGTPTMRVSPNSRTVRMSQGVAEVRHGARGDKSPKRIQWRKGGFLIRGSQVQVLPGSASDIKVL